MGRDIVVDRHNGDRLAAIHQEVDYLNKIGKSFVAAIDRFQVHRALLVALEELYHFSACSILLNVQPTQLSIIPCYPLSSAFLQAMFQRIAGAANVIDFPFVAVEDLAATAYLDAPDDLSQAQKDTRVSGDEIGSYLTIPLTVENRIIGLLSLFDEQSGTFDTDLLKLATVIADYAAIALENVRLRERETALWREAELGRLRSELIIRSIAEGLLITNAEGAVTSLNESARRLLAQAPLELQSAIPLRTLAATSHLPWLTALADIIEQALVGKVVMNQELIAGTSSDSVPLTLSVSAAPLHDASQTWNRTWPIGVVAVLNDITSHKQIEKLKDEFVSAVSHELRTPLTAIKGYTQHLIRRLERRLRKMSMESRNPPLEMPESYDLHSLNIVQSQTEHLERLVSDLLDLSRVQWGRLDLQRSSFHLADVLTECVHSTQASAEQHSILLDIQVQESTVLADRSRIGQVVGNLLDNAVKYSPRGGQVTVKLQRLDDDYLVSVSDQGIGVSPEYLDHIFERFYRVRNTASRHYSGIGLGLYVTKAIVEDHGGLIWFSSNNGLGSTFSFTLPATPRPQAPSSKRP